MINKLKRITEKAARKQETEKATRLRRAIDNAAKRIDAALAVAAETLRNEATASVGWIAMEPSAMNILRDRYRDLEISVDAQQCAHLTWSHSMVLKLDQIQRETQLAIRKKETAEQLAKASELRKAMENLFKRIDSTIRKTASEGQWEVTINLGAKEPDYRALSERYSRFKIDVTKTDDSYYAHLEWMP